MTRFRSKLLSYFPPARLLAAAAASVLFATAAQGGLLFPAWRNLYDNDPNGGQNRSQYTRGVAIDNRGNVAICGYIVAANGRNQLYVAKYAGLDGRAPLWIRTYEATAYAGNPTPGAYGTSVAIDSFGNVIVTGYEQTTNGFDYLTIKLASSNGAPQWAQRYDGTAGGSDQALKVVVDQGNNVIVTGRSTGSGTQYDIYTIKYNSAGVPQWAGGGVRYNYFVNSNGNRDDIPADLAVDGAGDVFISGLANRSGTDSFYVTKLDGVTGADKAGWPRLENNGGYGATALSVDRFGNVVVAGPSSGGGVNYNIRLIKYASNGVPQWSKDLPTETSENRWCGVGVDDDGNVSVVGTSAVDSTGQRMYTVRYKANGEFVWDRYSPAFNDTNDDTPQNLIVDGTSNTIVFGEATSEDRQGNLQRGLYVGTYSPVDGKILDELYLTDLEPRFEERIDSIDYTLQVAYNNLGGMILAGNYKKPKESGPFYVGYSAIKFHRLLFEKGETLVDPKIDEGKITSLGSPALSSTGFAAARVGLSLKKGKVNAIVTQDLPGNPVLPAVQNDDAPGGGKFKSFFDPVVAGGSDFGFIAKLSGVPAAESTAVFSTVTGPLASNLKTGQTIPALPDAKIKSISSISLSNELVALVKISGKIGDDPVTRKNDTVLVSVNNAGAITPILRTGQEVTVNGDATTIKSITTLTPAKGSAGHGRWHNSTRVLARVLLDDGRVAIASTATSGGTIFVAATGTSANVVKSGATWKTFGFPGTGITNSTNLVGLGVLQTDDNVSASEDNAIVYGTGNTFTEKVAVEGGSVPGIADATYDSFLDPVMRAQGQVAFQATIKGKDVKASNKSVIMWGSPSSPQLLVRQGDTALDSGAFETDQKFTSFLSLALPQANFTGPIFLAKVAGKGVNSKNNVGLWGYDSFGLVRQLLRTGDNLGGRIVTKITVLDARPGVSGTTRSFNSTASVLTLVSFKGGGSGIYSVGIP